MLLALTVFAPPATPGPPERDFEAYYAAGVTVNSGADPYSRSIWSAERRIDGVDPNRDELLPFVGPPAALPFWSLLGRLPYRFALAIWTLVLVGAAAAIVASALRLAHVRPDPTRIGFLCAFALAGAPLIGSLALGQAALLAAAGIAAALVTYRSRTPALALLATLTAAMQPNLALVLAARMRSGWDARTAAGAATLFVCCALLAGGGPAGWRRYFVHLRAHGTAERFIAIQHTPTAIGYAFGLPEPAAIALGALVALLALGATIVLIARERLDATTATLLTCAALPLAIPFFHEPDFVLELLPVALLALRATGRARSLGVIAAVLILVDWFGFAQRHGAQTQILCLAFAVTFAFVGLGLGPAAGQRGRLTDAYTGCALAIGLAAMAIPLGVTHPAPTWPDALPGTFRADPRLDASGVWASEQQAAGLRQIDPVWGALRAVPLVGCVVLGCALILDARRRRRLVLRRVTPDDVRRTADALALT